MLIIFGLRVFYRTIARGTFHCRRCGGDREYRHRNGRRWFTLFFIPVIPLGGNLFARCGVCGLNTKCTSELKDQPAIKAAAARA